MTDELIPRPMLRLSQSVSQRAAKRSSPPTLSKKYVMKREQACRRGKATRGSVRERAGVVRRYAIRDEFED